MRLLTVIAALAAMLVSVPLTGCGTSGSVTEDTADRESDTEGEEVFVGYGTRSDSLVTGSVDKVTAEELSEPADRSVLELLQGRTAGVTVSRQGGGFAVRIRGTSSFYGSNEPLYIVDGMQIAPGPGGYIGINPNDVASIEVLKDASTAAMYGVRGANGVIVITTKQYESVE